MLGWGMIERLYETRYYGATTVTMPPIYGEMQEAKSVCNKKKPVVFGITNKACHRTRSMIVPFVSWLPQFTPEGADGFLKQRDHSCTRATNTTNTIGS
jgi:hypothetical protein